MSTSRTAATAAATLLLFLPIFAPTPSESKAQLVVRRNEAFAFEMSGCSCSGGSFGWRRRPHRRPPGTPGTCKRLSGPVGTQRSALRLSNPLRRGLCTQNPVSDGGDASKPYRRLLEWAVVGGAILSPRLKTLVRPPSEGGAGLCAAESITPGLDLVRLPPEHIRFDAGAVLEVIEDGPVKIRLAELAGGSRIERTAALTGALAHMHLLRTDDPREEIETRFGPFLDILPLPQCDQKSEDGHPCHVLWWSDEEISVLLSGTMAHYRARSILYDYSKVKSLLSPSFLSEHCTAGKESCSQKVSDVLISSFACVLSRGFADSVLGGARGMFVPILDLLNHSPSSNVRWDVDDSSGMAVLRATRDVYKGDELLADYGSRPSWDFGIEYGFVPPLDPCSDWAGITLFPVVLTMADGRDISLLSGSKQLQHMAGTICAAVESTMGEESRPIILPLFRPSKKELHAVQLCVVVQVQDSSLLPTFRAVSCVLSALSENRTASVEEVRRATVNGYKSKALELIKDGIEDRREMLEAGGKEAESWAMKSRGTHIMERLDLARSMRDAELAVLGSVEQDLDTKA